MTIKEQILECADIISNKLEKGKDIIIKRTKDGAIKVMYYVPIKLKNENEYKEIIKEQELHDGTQN